MATLNLLGNSLCFSWYISDLSSNFNTDNGFVSAGISTRSVTSGATSISGVVDSVDATASWSNNWTTIQVVDYPEGTYTFYGWTLAANGKYYPAGSASVIVKGETVTYYVTVEYDTNGGKGGPSGGTYSQEDDSTYYYTFPYTEPTRTGYAFDGWKPDGYSTVYQPGNTMRLYMSANGTVYTMVAQWTSTQEYSATLAFDANGGAGAPGAVTGTNTGSSTITLTIPGTIPSRTGYSFDGWLLTFSSGSSTYKPGGTATLEGTTSGIVYTAYAIWTKVETGGGVWIYTDNDWAHATKYIVINGVWKKDTPYVVTDNDWKKGI